MEPGAPRGAVSPTAEFERRCRELFAASRTPPECAALFGSWARMEASTRSDVDVFLVRPQGVGDTDWDALVGDLEGAVTSWTGNDARAFVLRRSELLDAGNTAVLMSIFRDGRELWGDLRALRNEVVHGQGDRRVDAHR